MKIIPKFTLVTIVALSILTLGVLEFKYNLFHTQSVFAGDENGTEGVAHNPEEKALFEAQQALTKAKENKEPANVLQELQRKIDEAQRLFEQTDYFKQKSREGGVGDYKYQPKPATGGCDVISGYFKPSGDMDEWYDNYDGQPPLDIVVKTKNCLKQTLSVTVFEQDTCIQNCDDAWSIGVAGSLYRREFNVQTDNFTINLLAGEEECESAVSIVSALTSWMADCKLFFYIRQGNNILYNSWFHSGGTLTYDCDFACLTDPKFVGVKFTGDDDHPIDTGSKLESGKFNDVYTLLSPIGSLECISTDGTNKDGVKDKCATGGLGYYLNLIFTILIGICGVLSVVMIIVHAIQYMGDESVFGKTEAKGKIVSAILGLIIALVSYALLNTIDPALTGKEGVSVEGVDIQLEEKLALLQAGYDENSLKNLSAQQIRDIVISYRGKFKYIQDEYIPARNKAVIGASKGALTLMTAQTAFEGFYPGARSYRTKNPGNIGNTEKDTKTFNSLEEGILEQYKYISKVMNGTHPRYQVGKRVKADSISEAGILYPGIDIVYNGTLEHYLKVYAVGARKDNNYLSYIISFFKKEGLTITPQTTLKQIYSM